MNAFAEGSDRFDGLDLRALFANIIARRWWVIGSMMLSIAVFSCAAFVMTPLYRATTLLAPAIADRGAEVLGSRSAQLGGLAALTGLGLGSRDAEIEEALAVLQSREFTESFISKRNLLPRFFPDKWSSATGMWKVDRDHQPTLAKAFKYFDRVRVVTRDRKTGLIALQIDWRDRDEAAAWANDLVRLLNEEMRARAVAKADAAMQFLNKELETTSTVEARDAISRLMEAQVKQRMLANVTPEYSLRVVDRAIAPDKDDPVSPRKSRWLASGPLFGLALGIGLVILFGAPSHAKRGPPPPASDE